MKKFFAVIVAVLAITSASAQTKGDISAGVDLSFSTVARNAGIGVKGLYNITDNIRVEADFDYFFLRDWDLFAYGHYLFPIKEKIAVYPLIGIGVLSHYDKDLKDLNDDLKEYYEALGMPTDDDDFVSPRSTNFGFQFGGGVQYKLLDPLSLNFEIKGQLGYGFGAVFSLGCIYTF